jgi:hypothetical protein
MFTAEIAKGRLAIMAIICMFFQEGPAEPVPRPFSDQGRLRLHGDGLLGPGTGHVGMMALISTSFQEGLSEPVPRHSAPGRLGFMVSTSSGVAWATWP